MLDVDRKRDCPITAFSKPLVSKSVLRIYLFKISRSGEIVTRQRNPSPCLTDYSYASILRVRTFKSIKRTVVLKCGKYSSVCVTYVLKKC